MIKGFCRSLRASSSGVSRSGIHTRPTQLSLSILEDTRVHKELKASTLGIRLYHTTLLSKDQLPSGYVPKAGLSTSKTRQQY